jgi:GT2 family glycosyltransferase
VVVLSFNRRTELERTLNALRAGSVTRTAEIIVADNGSRDGSAALVRQNFPDIRVIDLRRNLGVAGFNRGVDAARGQYVLVLDDDAVPDQEGLAGALSLLEAREELGAVALHPVHPASRVSEWPFAGPWQQSVAPRAVRTDWPVMGSGNLVRRADWLAVGGYEEGFFLYRNDTDLAMRLLHAGLGVAFDPTWVVWHDSPATARKSLRWFEIATRNWLWLARRHGRGWTGLAGGALGWAWAHRLAGLSPGRHIAAIRGAFAGLFSPKPTMRTDRPSDGAAFASLLRLQIGARLKKPG